MIDDKASFIFDNSFKIFPRNFIWPRSGQIVVFIDGALKFITWGKDSHFEVYFNGKLI